jgi:A/G-specific adenine glycosylase
LLGQWYERVRRDLPWRSTTDPYAILVSEFMLQQTRAETVIPYYHRFLAQFPDARALAEAREGDVLACWSGLGYYSRARNLQRAARQIMAAGAFPADYDGIRALSGVGPYTAAAVASIAFGRPHAALDGNVVRVIARLRGDGADIALAKTRARFQQITDELLDRRHAGRFNQAMMELGATVCLPRRPQCQQCPVARFCDASATGRQQELPVKRGKPALQQLSVRLALVERRGALLMRLRPTEESLMPGFWELPTAENLPGWKETAILGSFRHTITHHHYTITVLRGRISKAPTGLHWRPLDRLESIPLTTVSRKALRLRSAGQ